MIRIERSMELNQLKGISDFINLASRYCCEIKVKGRQNIVDGKSIMGIISLASYQPLTIVAEGDDAQEFAHQLDKFQIQ